MNTVWNVQRNGQIVREEFDDVDQAMNRCKQTSLANFCSFLETANKKFFVFENGEIANPRRTKELSSQTEETILQQYAREMGGNGKGKRKK